MTERKFVTYYISIPVLIIRLSHYECIGFSSQFDVSPPGPSDFQENREVLPPAGDTVMSQRAFRLFLHRVYLHFAVWTGTEWEGNDRENVDMESHGGIRLNWMRPTKQTKTGRLRLRGTVWLPEGKTRKASPTISVRKGPFIQLTFINFTKVEEKREAHPRCCVAILHGSYPAVCFWEEEKEPLTGGG